MTKQNKISFFAEHWEFIKDLNLSEKAQVLEFLFTDKMPEKGEAKLICGYIKNQQDRIKEYSEKQRNYKLQGLAKHTLQGASRSSKVAQGSSSPYPILSYPDPCPKEDNILSDSQANADGIQPDVSSKVGKNGGNGAAYKQDALEVLRFLCECTGRQYRPVPANLNPIVIKLKSGITVPDCKDVIAFKAETWGRDEKMAQYIRPKTLFAASNFENYLAEALAGFGDSKREWR